MGEPTNKDRAEWAQTGLDRFAEETGLDPKDDGYQMIVGDFLADLMHFCKQHKVPFTACLSTGEWHFKEELREEKEEKRLRKAYIDR